MVTMRDFLINTLLLFAFICMMWPPILGAFIARASDGYHEQQLRSGTP